MENERRDEEFTIVLNRWHMPYRRGAQCAPMQRHIKRFAGGPYGYTSANDFGMGTHVLPSR